MYEEIERLKVKLNNNNVIEESEERLYECVREVFKANSNPYRLWKCVSDIRGDNYFLEIFM
jgi:hypothetical protein